MCGFLDKPSSTQKTLLQVKKNKRSKIGMVQINKEQIIFNALFSEIKNKFVGVPCRGPVETNLTSTHEDTGLIPDLAIVAVSCGVVGRCSSDLAFLWHRPVAIAPI